MDLIEILQAEHRLILRQLHYLELAAGTKGPKYLAHGLKQMTLLVADTVERHSRAEDRFLFPELGKHIGGRSNYVAMMNFEHGEVLGILSALEATDDPRKINVEVMLFIRSLRAHFAKEEKSYFKIAVKKIGLPRLRALGRKYIR